MSDAAVRAVLDAAEAWLADPETLLDTDFLERWNRDFQAAVAAAERGPGWAELVARAHRLAGQVEARQRAVEARREAVRGELQLQARGHRALKGYGSGLR